MRMEKILIILSLSTFLFMGNVRGQQIKISHEMNYSSNDGFALVGEIKDTIMLFKEKNFDYSFEVFNENLEFLFEKEVFFEKQRIKIMGFFTRESDATLIYSYDSHFKHYIRAIKYDPRGNILDSTQVFGKREVFFEDSFQPVLSNDKNLVLLFREIKYNMLEFILFDLRDFEIKWTQQLLFEDYKIDEDLNGVVLTNKGEIILAFEENNYSLRRKKHFQEIVVIETTKGQSSSFKIDFKGLISTSFIFDSDEMNDEIIISGLFSQRYSQRSEGYYLYKLNRGGITQALSAHPFSQKLLSEHAGNKKVRRYIKDLSVKDFIIRRDGGILLIAEMQKRVARESVRRRYMDYHFEDMILLSIHPEGELFWQDIIRKYQLSYDDNARYSSYFLFETPSKVKIIFNDEIKSENTISEYSFSPLGNGNRRSLFATDLHKLKLLFEDATQVSSKSFLVPSMHHGKYRIIKLSY